MLKSRLIFGFILCLFFSCKSGNEQKIIGEWKLDSAYYHYNQFDFSSEGWHQEEIYKFLPSGEAITSAVNASVSNKYSIKDNRLNYFDANGGLVNVYEILSINAENMVLRMEKKPLFKGANQNRFEIRYFSKVN
ncbi:hypothetical protein [Cyclobacterium qasimii]|uniref:Lipocalin-like domain-containing protein n=2 Tax=Cyclobacterium qasimii TaxID=1350429 RepID=S7VDM9_9BACT|nr:hypothetical protein [Cyclobacterium qasimii]EPR67652.1 hypothetical protein ADICYQ_3292 [Cyclobacterium qasimii M12-11B]GEO19483.1 hypothetical protein CQA01_00170 [Cyclobacterium qasimii]